MSHVTFTTPEDVEITYEPAGPGTRYLAVFIDQLIIGIVTVVLVVTVVLLVIGLQPLVERVQETVQEGGGQTLLWLVVAVGFLLKFLVDTTYYILFEIMSNGQTPGKKYLEIQVIQEGGRALTATSCLLRNLMRVVDNIPLSWPLVLFSPQHKRLGDYVAGTVVVSKRPVRDVRERVQGPLYGELDAHRFELTADHARELTDADFEVLVSYLERRAAMKVTAVAHLRRRLCETYARRLFLPVTVDPVNQDRFLFELAAFLREQSLRRQI